MAGLWKVSRALRAAALSLAWANVSASKRSPGSKIGTAAQKDTPRGRRARGALKNLNFANANVLLHLSSVEICVSVLRLFQRNYGAAVFKCFWVNNCRPLLV